MRKLSETLKLTETYFREEPSREEPPKSKEIVRIEEFAHDKSKRNEIIKAWTQIKDHPEAVDMKSEVGSAFDEIDLDEEMRAAYDAIGPGGMIWCSFEHSFWIRHKGQLIRVM